MKYFSKCLALKETPTNNVYALEDIERERHHLSRQVKNVSYYIKILKNR